MCKQTGPHDTVKVTLKFVGASGKCQSHSNKEECILFSILSAGVGMRIMAISCEILCDNVYLGNVSVRDAVPDVVMYIDFFVIQ